MDEKRNGTAVPPAGEPAGGATPDATGSSESRAAGVRSGRAIAADDLRRAAEVLEALIEDRGRLAAADADVRARLVAAASRVGNPDGRDKRKLVKAFKKAERREQKQRDQAVVEETGLRVQRKAPVLVAAARPALPGALGPDHDRELAEERFCYVCKAPYRKLHFFYDSMCPACGDFNYAKRSQSADLRGRVALVTGARVKIGFQISLMLLRAGARVVATTRFPVDSAERYAKEPDFAEFKDRLQIHGLDLRHIPSVELFTRYLESRLDRLDFVVNNACQTVRRPPGWYAHLLDRERALPDGDLGRLLASHHDLVAAMGNHAALPSADLGPERALGLWQGAGPSAGVGLWGSAALSQVPYLNEDTARRDELFPTGRLDADLQQVDLRSVNSWRLKLADVATPEMLEVHLVNAAAPFVLNARLKPLMARTPGRDKHIVNVSAMEGQFNRGTKTDRHPHTNMAKAALNMMTRTSAADYVKDGIHMNSVDTGWVTDEDPAAIAARKEEEGFQPPLDIVDGAARVVDPIFDGVNTGAHVWGKFLKDYKPCAW